MTNIDLSINAEESARVAMERLAAVLPPDGGYPEDVPEALRNAWRGRRSLQAVAAYAARDGGGDSEPVEQYVRDLLCDLMHLVDLFKPAPDGERAFDFDTLLARAFYMHGDEACRP